MKQVPTTFLPVYRPAPGRPVPRWLREAQVALVLGKIRVVSADQVEGERGRGSFDFELVSIAAAAG
jgi:hypothetical protein